MELIQIDNNGQKIRGTNYFDTEWAKRGMFFLSWNAGAARLLIPDSQKKFIREMKTAKHIVFTRPPLLPDLTLQIVFEDNSPNPFVMTLPLDQVDFNPYPTLKSHFVLTAWTRKGLQGGWSAKYQQGYCDGFELPWLTILNIV